MTLIYIPEIDVSPLFEGAIEKKRLVAKQIDEACRGPGFFFAKNHGIDLKKLLDVTEKFQMAMTDEEKWELAIVAYNKDNVKQKRNGYYMPIDGKKAVQSYCFLNPAFTQNHLKIKAGVDLHEVNIWPNEGRHPGFRAFQEQYFRDVFDFSMVLLRGFAIALDKEENFFEQYISTDNHLSAVSLIRYPYLEDYPPVKVAEDGTKLSFEKHKDVSLITVLYQSKVQNLQVSTQSGYLDIPATDDSYLVNVGTYMTYITNNYYQAPLHRVKWVNEERLSLPLFLNMDDDSSITPFIPHSNQPSENLPVSYGEYLKKGLFDLIVSNSQT